MEFVLRDLLDFDKHYANLPGGEELTPDLLDAILEGGAQIAEEVLAPLNEVGDREGCKLGPDGVTTPTGFKEAYQAYVEGGWPSLSGDTEYGGQGLPASISLIFNELTSSANWSFGMYPGLSQGAIRCLYAHGSEEQKNRYLPPMVEGRWTGTMCLTEPHCGTDLGLLRTKATPNADGSYAITGTKIFISSGDHDMAENIVHLLIGRVEGAPEGTAGISLFIVPKILVNEDGSLGERNAVECGALEEKMGIHGNATCVMNFDGATGYLVGQENKGLANMFTMMNTARLGTALQGLAHAEVSLQKSVEYARERLQMRSLSGAKNPDGAADPIIVHPDVRRMLLNQKAFTEGSRALYYFLAMQVDNSMRRGGEVADQAETYLAMLTPIAKAFMTELGFESVNDGLQIFGGHGFIREHGMEQQVRDARISRLYEGTTGIQALDLLGRKVLGNGGKDLMHITKMIHEYCKQQNYNAGLKEFIDELSRLNKEWGEMTMNIGTRAMENPEEVGAASVDYLMYSGYVVLAYIWARMAEVSINKLAAGEGYADFYQAKLNTARFYYQRMLPRTLAHAAAINNGADSLMATSAEAMYLG
jgi:alkylation response protein AidB-like acyl-CoA dehydrogenase